MEGLPQEQPAEAAPTPEKPKQEEHPADYGMRPEHLDELYNGMKSSGVEILNN